MYVPNVVKVIETYFQIYKRLIKPNSLYVHIFNQNATYCYYIVRKVKGTHTIRKINGY